MQVKESGARGKKSKVERDCKKSMIIILLKPNPYENSTVIQGLGLPWARPSIALVADGNVSGTREAARVRAAGGIHAAISPGKKASCGRLRPRDTRGTTAEPLRFSSVHGAYYAAVVPSLALRTLCKSLCKSPCKSLR